MAPSGPWKPRAPVSQQNRRPVSGPQGAGVFSMHRRVWGRDDLTGGLRKVWGPRVGRGGLAPPLADGRGWGEGHRSGLSWDSARKQPIIELEDAFGPSRCSGSLGSDSVVCTHPTALWPLEPSLLRGSQIPDTQEPLKSYRGVSHGWIAPSLCSGKCTHSHHVSDLALRNG